MVLKGLQKLTLLDFPEKMACTVFTAGCNFRCPFCHNASLVIDVDKEEIITEDEFFEFLSKRTTILDGVAITGGEPTLQTDLKEFITKIKSMGFAVKLDTNGYKPEILKELVNEKLVDYVAMDVKNSKEKYAETIGLKNFDISKIEESVNFLKDGNVPYEFRTTVIKEYHTAEDITKIAQWLKGSEKYFLQAFKDSGDLICAGLNGYDKTEMESLLKIAKNSLEITEVRGI